ncbi:hypothetical protein ACFX13_013314 [Malus domestica]|uniref:uncharacterized protein n=1 Tax=Malus domestica TaxID=3750 RepID=UPI003974E22F
MTSFAGNLFTFVFLSLLIFSLRMVVENGTHFLTSFVENGTHFLTSFVNHDPSLKSLISCLDLAGIDNTNCRSPNSPTESPSQISLRRRHRPFLHLTCFGTLDDDFFSGFNETYGTRVSEIVRSSLTFKAEKFTISDDRARGRDGDGESNEGEEKGSDEELDDRAVDLQFLINGLELGRRDVATLFFLLKV